MALSRTLDRVGLVLGGRYRLLSPIGTGASASVYLADDVTLRRRVAVKVLHEALAEDEAFLRRFQAEAQAAAALNHPHIMAVYDWGDTGEWPFLVMEHLGGGSLRAVLDESPLSLSQALVVGLEAARGLDYAHRRGFVHRDIKPANLLFDEEARLRIADFGLARALAEAAWTEPMGAVLGTARYASPEQAQGLVLDGRSDVYSLALVLIEAVTGHVPFQADTTIGTLVARVDRELPVPAELGALRPALEAAGRPDPAERVDAAGFGSLLLRAAEHLDRPRPIRLPGTQLPRELEAERHPTDVAAPAAEPAAAADPAAAGPVATGPVAGRIVVPDPVDDITGIVDLRRAVPTGGTGPTWGDEIDEADPVFDWQDDSDLGGRRARRRHRRDPDAPDPDPVGGPDATALLPLGGSALDTLARADELAHPDEGTRRERKAARKAARRAERAPRRGRRALAVVLVLALLGGGGYAGWWYLIRIPVHTVPSFVGQPLGTAQQAAATNRWRITQTNEFADGTAAGQVLRQTPAAGTALEEQQGLTLVVSNGPPPVPVPADLVGVDLDTAGQRLAAAGLTVGDIERRFDETAAAGTVLALADGTPAEVPKGGAVALVASAGPEPRTIPADLVGKTSDAASTRLRDLGLKVAVDEEFSETVTKGQVMAVAPAAGEKADKGSTVRLTVSKGPPTVPVPSVAGLSVVDAGNKLEAAGLVVSGTQGSPTKPVVGTSPAAGTTVRKGSAVTIVTG